MANQTHERSWSHGHGSKFSETWPGEVRHSTYAMASICTNGQSNSSQKEEISDCSSLVSLLG